jgi:hypothetical protein
MTKNKYVLFFILASLTFSCNSGVNRTWKNESINEDLKKEISGLDKKVIQSLKTDNPEMLQSILSPDLIEKGVTNLDSIVHLINKSIQGDDYSILDQYLIKNTTNGLNTVILSNNKNINDYTVQFKVNSKQSFVSLIIPKGGINKLLVTTVYGKFKEGWKVNIIHFGYYKLDGKTAPELYAQAKEEYDKGYLMDAANTVFLCGQIIKPADSYFKYDSEEEILKFNEKVIAEVNSKYNFPITLDNVETQPKIINIFPQYLDEGYFPCIEYQTQIDLDDTTRTTIENKMIQEEIGSMFPGINKDKRYVLYVAYNEIPDGKHKVDVYRFVQYLE